MKFKIKDADGNDYEVEEVEEEKVEEKPELTSEEIVALKTLAATAPNIMKLLDVEKKEHEAVEDEDKDEDEDEEDIEKRVDVDLDDEDADEDEDKLIETEVKKIKKDSKKSFGSNEKRKTKDSVNLDDEIAAAWSKRYGGNY